MGDLSERPLEWDSLPSLFPELRGASRWLGALRRHDALLREHSALVRATSVDANAAPMRLFAESLEVLRIVTSHTERPIEMAVDVGSGGGFPGMVFAAVMPSWRVKLIESNRKKAALLDLVGDELHLTNVEVVATRAEQAGRSHLRGQADLVTARAVAEVREVLEYTVPFARPGGLIALPKGSRLPEELSEAGRAMEELHVEVLEQVRCRPEVSSTPWTLLLRRVGATPERYPRRPGMPHKRPL
jgi:16S rRNA (guanine527-N7)-methyltransferase